MEKTLLKTFNAYCRLKGITGEYAAVTIFGVSRQFMHAVLSFKTGCPEKMLDKMCKEFGAHKEVLGVAFGRYPEDWLQFLRERPGRAQKAIHGILKREGYRDRAAKIHDQRRGVSVIKETASRSYKKSSGRKG